MPNFELVTRIHVLTAIKVHDQGGAAEFLSELGFDGPGDDVLVERGKRYEPRALLAFAHGRATGTPLSPDEVTLDSLTVLTDLGFTIASIAELDRPAPVRATRPRTTQPRTPQTEAAKAKAAATRAATRAAAKRVPGTAHKPMTADALKAAPVEPAVKVCPSCYTALPATGRCDYCD